VVSSEYENVSDRLRQLRHVPGEEHDPVESAGETSSTLDLEAFHGVDHGTPFRPASLSLSGIPKV
jgi:hypothetical protein